MDQESRKHIMMNDIEKEFYNLYHVLKSHKRKIEKAREIIKESLLKTKKFTISCSFGKDSLVLLDLVFNITDKCKVIQSDSGYQLPETYKVRKKCEEKYGFKTIIMPQIMTFDKFLNKYGLPGINRTIQQQKQVVEDTKKNRLDTFAKSNGSEGTFWGIRKEESKGRRLLLNTRGALFYSNSRQSWYSAPLAGWTAKDTWSYISWYDLEYPEFYDKQNCGQTRDWIRNSSWVTTDGAVEGSLVWLKYNYPNFFNKLAKQFPEVKGYV